MKKLSLFFSLAILAIAFASCGKSLKTTAVLNNEIDSVNYAFGVAIGSGEFKRQFNAEKDTAKIESFKKAFLNGFNTDFRKLSDSKSQQINGNSAGISLTTMLEEGNFRFGLQNGCFFEDSVLTVKKDLIQKFVLDALNGKNEVGGFTIETAQVFFGNIYRKTHDTVPYNATIEEVDSLNAAFAVMMASNFTQQLDSAKRTDFVKGFKEGLKINANSPKKYEVLGSATAIQGFDFLSKNGLMGDSTLTLQSKIFLAGINAGLLSDTTIMTQETAQKYLMGVSEAKRKAQTEKLYGNNITEGEQFLAENAKRAEVKVTESGLQYEVIKEGKGAKPKATDNVNVHYHGTLINGTVFDSSVERGEPISFPLNGVIAGWTEALQLMSVGSKYKLYIPYNLAYGERNAGAIEPFSTLIFEVELLGIEKPE